MVFEWKSIEYETNQWNMRNVEYRFQCQVVTKHGKQRNHRTNNGRFYQTFDDRRLSIGDVGITIVRKKKSK